jgi:hypothetical protein
MPVSHRQTDARLSRLIATVWLFDVTVASCFPASRSVSPLFLDAARDAGAAATVAERRRASDYASRAAFQRGTHLGRLAGLGCRVEFRSFAIDVYEALGSSAKKVARQLSQSLDADHHRRPADDERQHNPIPASAFSTRRAGANCTPGIFLQLGRVENKSHA